MWVKYWKRCQYTVTSCFRRSCQWPPIFAVLQSGFAGFCAKSIQLILAWIFTLNDFDTGCRIDAGLNFCYAIIRTRMSTTLLWYFAKVHPPPSLFIKHVANAYPFFTNLMINISASKTLVPPAKPPPQYNAFIFFSPQNPECLPDLQNLIYSASFFTWSLSAVFVQIRSDSCRS